MNKHGYLLCKVCLCNERHAVLAEDGQHTPNHDENKGYHPVLLGWTGRHYTDVTDKMGSRGALCLEHVQHCLIDKLVFSNN